MVASLFFPFHQSAVSISLRPIHFTFPSHLIILDLLRPHWILESYLHFEPFLCNCFHWICPANTPYVSRTKSDYSIFLLRSFTLKSIQVRSPFRREPNRKYCLQVFYVCVLFVPRGSCLRSQQSTKPFFHWHPKVYLRPPPLLAW
jgi:hypothetical protein